MNCWLDRKAAMWYQRSRLNWFQAGDLNTRFFHARASSCYKKNIIAGLTDPNGIWHEEEHKIEEILIRHYKDLFYSTRPSKFIELGSHSTKSIRTYESDVEQDLSRQ